MVLKTINGSHHIFSHAEKTEVISVPVHKNDDLKIGLQRKLMSIAEITDDDLYQKWNTKMTFKEDFYLNDA